MLRLTWTSSQVLPKPYNGFGAARRLDRWFGERPKAGDKGPGIGSTGKDGDRVVGVVAGEEMYADVVVAADGANRSGPRGRPARTDRDQSPGCWGERADRTAARNVEECFNLTGDEGAAYGLVGYVTKRRPGGGFLYTKESISIGVAHLDN